MYMLYVLLSKIGMKILKKINKQNFINLIIEDYIKVMY